MKFTKAPDTINYLNRHVSTGGRWEIGLMPRTFNRFAVGFNVVDADGPIITYCCGESRPFQMAVQFVIMTILEGYPENVSERQLRQDFPEWAQRPIDRDPCWSKLQAMAWRALGEKGRANAVLREESLKS